MIGRYIGLLAIHCLILQAFEQWILTDGLVLPDMETEAASAAICIHLYAGWKRWQTKKLYGKFYTECGMEYIRLSLRGQGKSFLKSVI